MPLSIKTGAVKVKDSEGDYVDIDLTLSDGYAPLESPAFTGTPTAPTPGVSDDSTKVATTAFVQDVVDSLDAGDIEYSSGAAYSNGSTGKAISDLNSSVSNLNGAITSLENSSASVDWAPSSGDTLLAFLIANITNRNRLPFSFVKRTSNTVSDAPTNLQSIEFTGVVFGSGDRLTVLISKYGSGHDEVYTRNIYQDEFYGSWHAVTSKLLRFSAVALSSGVSNGQIARVPSSGTNAALTEDSFVVGFHFSNPTAIYSGITVTKYSGYFTLTGTTGTNAGTIDIVMGNQ